VLQAYRGYVEHENHLRNQMREHRFAGGSLRSWRRAFFLDPQLRPTRASVIDLQYLRGSFSNEWYWPKAPHESAEAADANRGLVKQFIDQFAGDIHPDEGHPRRTGPQRHGLVSGASLRTVYEEFLTKFRVSRPTDSTRFTGLLLQIGRYLDQHPEATNTIYQMSNGTSRMRSVDDDDEIPILFTGSQLR
jgi:hypothetical protein